MRSMKVLVVATIAVAMVAGVAGSAEAARPVRSGTIVVAARSCCFLAPAAGCTGTADCLPWLTACSQPAPAEVGLSSSFVDVRNLAGASKKRTFAIVDRQNARGAFWGYPLGLDRGVNVEFWDEYCREVLPAHSLQSIWRATFKIPRHVRWMSVTSGEGWLGTSFSGLALRWELR